MNFLLNSIRQLKNIRKTFVNLEQYLKNSFKFKSSKNNFNSMISEEDMSDNINQEIDNSTLASEPTHETKESKNDAGGDKLIMEGRAKIRSPMHVFYNPVQEFNRDLTVLVATRLSMQTPIHCPATLKRAATKKITAPEGIRILEALAATGLRSVRFALEVPNVKCVVANDYDDKAVDYIRQNALLNGVEALVRPNCGDASLFMHQNKNFTDRFHLVDLDPYGSPTPFLDAAVQCVVDGGILCITSTDMAVLCGNAPETCMSKYGVVGVRTKCCHELAIRILLRSIESHANRYSRYILPLLSLSVDFYCRVFVQVFTSQKEVKNSCTKLSHLFYCSSCSTPYLHPLCDKTPTSPLTHKFSPSSLPSDFSPNCGVCGGRVVMAGPVWSENIHHQAFVKELLGGIGEKNGGVDEKIGGISGESCGVASDKKQDGVNEKVVAESDEKMKEKNCRKEDEAKMQIDTSQGNSDEKMTKKHDEDMSKLMAEKLSGLKTRSRIEGMLSVVGEELENVPLYYDSDHLCSVLHCTCISFIAFRSALLNGGYKVSSSHACKTSVKTNAPPDVVWDIMRCWVKVNPISKNRNIEGSPAQQILSQPIKFHADFTPHPLANPVSRSKGLLRWQVNPQKYWGPKPKATRAEKKKETKGKAKKHKSQDKSDFLCKKVRLADCPFAEKCVYRHEDDEKTSL